jgi:hypothetical protein
MTQKEAKELTLELWRYLAEHPECFSKMRVPDSLLDRIRPLQYQCPLCESMHHDDHCKGCPLADGRRGCEEWDSPWRRWRLCGIDNVFVRKAAAERIVKIVSAWEPEEGE